MPLVQALRHTPYRQPKQMETPEDDADVQVALDLAVRVGELLLRCGGSSRDVEASVIAVAAAAGLNHLEVDVTNQSLLVQGMKAHGRPHTVLRVVRSTRRDFSRLVAVHRLVEDLVGGRIGREDAAGRVESIATSHRFWPRWVVSLGYGLLAASVATLLGAGLPAVGLSLVSAFVVDQIGRFFARIGLPAFYLAAIGATVATMFAWGGFMLGHLGLFSVSREDMAYLVAGGIVVLLPGRAMASAVQDAITGYPVTGAGRLFGVGLASAGIIAGVAAGLAVSARLDRGLQLGFGPPTHLAVSGAGTALGVKVLAGAIGGAASGVSQRTRLKLILPTAVLGALGVLISGLAGSAGLSTLTGVTLACIVIGFGGRLVALRMGAPAVVLLVPAIGPLLPGLAIFRGMSDLVTGTGAGQGATAPTTGLIALLGATATALAIATGAVLGDLIAVPFDRQIIWGRRYRRR